MLNEIGFRFVCYLGTLEMTWIQNVFIWNRQSLFTFYYCDVMSMVNSTHTCLCVQALVELLIITAILFCCKWSTIRHCSVHCLHLTLIHFPHSKLLMRCDIFMTQSSKLNIICLESICIFNAPVSVWFVDYCTYWGGADRGWVDVLIGKPPTSTTLMVTFSLL